MAEIKFAQIFRQSIPHLSVLSDGRAELSLDRIRANAQVSHGGLLHFESAAVIRLWPGPFA
jgi:hypothetical protein